MLRISAIILLFIVTDLFSQVRPSVNNILRYGNGKQNIGNLTNGFQYFENLTDFRLGLPNNFNVGLRFLYDAPPEVGESFQGIQKRFLEFSDDNLNVRIGNSTELYGRGLVLNLFENRGLAYDTWIDGIKANYQLDKLSASIIAGDINFRDSVNVTRNELHKLRGGNIEYEISDFIKLGGSFIYSKSTLPQIDKNKIDAVSELPEIYADLNTSNISLFLSYANKSTTSPIITKASKGNAFYSSFSFIQGSLGITLEYKNYNFDEQNPLSKDDVTRSTKVLAFQNPPIVMKEHNYVLLTRALHEVDFNDEVGFQADVNYSPNTDLNLNLNFSLASRHNTYALNNNFSFNKLKRSGNFFPSLEDKYSPYYEVFAEAEYYFNLYTILRFGTAFRKKTSYNYFTGNSGTHKIKSFVVPMQFQHSFSSNLSSTFQYEFESVNDNYNTGQINFANHFVSLIASIKRKLTIALRYEFTSNDYEISGKKNWFVTELGYRITNTNLISVSYGSERGGQVCSNGVCRYILPFKGFRLNFQANL